MIALKEIFIIGKRKIKMNLIAWGLETHNPAAYALIFLILYPPIFIIIFAIIDWIKEKILKLLSRM